LVKVMKSSLKRNLLLALSTFSALPWAASQTIASAPTSQSIAAASAPTAVPPLVSYSGVVFDAQGRPPANTASISFLIFKNEAGGEPLFAETQTVALDSTGHFKVQLGATLPNGLPQDLFSTGEARWLEVQVAGEAAQPRVLLVSVPYALKAGDATTLGGLPASAYALTGTKPATVASSTESQNLISDTTATVTTSGGGAGYLPVFNGASTIVDSIIFQNATGIGVGTSAPAAKLDVNGTAIVTGALSAGGGATFGGAVAVSAVGKATPTAGFGSHSLSFAGSTFNSGVSLPVAQTFELAVEPIGNDTAEASSALEVLFGQGTAAPTPTGLSIGANGRITFAPGQTFPGTADGTITGVTAGTDLTGGGTSGNVTLNLNVANTDVRYARLAAANSFTANQTVKGSVTASSFVGTGAGLTGVTAANSAELGGLAADSYALLSANNTFAGIQSFSKIGIGTTTPRSLLEGQATASKALGPIFTLTNTAGGLGAESALDFNTLLPSKTGIYNPMARIAASDANAYSDSLLFQSNKPGAQNNGLQTNMVITSAGLVGIGTMTPASQLQVNGTVTATSFAGNGSGLTNVNANELGGHAPGSFAQVGVSNVFGAGQTVNGTVTATSFAGNGSGLTNVNATELGGLTPGAYAQVAANNTFTGNQTITGNLSASGTASAGTVNAANAFNLGGAVFAFGSQSNGNAYVGFAGNSSSSTNTGTDNTATGFHALYANTTGVNNNATGTFALSNNTMGNQNTAVGFGALENNTTGSDNTAAGFGALEQVTGQNNVGVGLFAGRASYLNPPPNGSNNTMLGSYTTIGTDGSITNATAIGAFAEVDQSNTLVLGCTPGIGYGQCPGSVSVGIGTTTPDELLSVNGSADKAGGGSWDTYSDGRLKTVNGSFDSGLNQVLKLHPIRYRYKPDNALSIRDTDEHIGVVAQEVQRVIPEAVTENGKGYLLVNNDPIIWSMVNAIKEQQREIEQQQKLLLAQSAVNEEQQKLLRAQSSALRSLRAEVRETRKTLSRVKAQAAAAKLSMVASK
jgi:hypothetical protein